MVVLALAIGLQVYFQSNRLLVDAERVCLANININREKCNGSLVYSNAVLLDDVEEFNVIVPVGLVLRCRDDGRRKFVFFPLFWDGPSVQAVMEERLGREVKQTFM